MEENITRLGLGREINALLVHGGCHSRCRSKLTGSFNHYRARWLGEVVGDPLQDKHFRPSPPYRVSDIFAKCCIHGKNRC
jgi:hypothetical protein